MKRIIYNPNENINLFPDGMMEIFAYNFLTSEDWNEIIISQELFLKFIQLWVARGIVDPSIVVFEYGDYNNILIDSEGLFNSWPDGFCDKTEKISTEMIKLWTKKEKKWIS